MSASEEQLVRWYYGEGFNALDFERLKPNQTFLRPLRPPAHIRSLVNGADPANRAGKSCYAFEVVSVGPRTRFVYPAYADGYDGFPADAELDFKVGDHVLVANAALDELELLQNLVRCDTKWVTALVAERRVEVAAPRIELVSP